MNQTIVVKDNSLILSSNDQEISLRRISGLEDPEFGIKKKISLNILGQEINFMAEKIPDGRFRASAPSFLKALGITYLYF